MYICHKQAICATIFGMNDKIAQEIPADVLIVAIPETAGSALYGMLDVLAATGNIWPTLLRSGDERQFFRVRIVSPDGRRPRNWWSLMTRSQFSSAPTRSFLLRFLRKIG